MSTSTTTPAMPLPEDLTTALTRMRMPYLRAAAPEVLATARAQRWDPTELLRVLLTVNLPGSVGGFRSNKEDWNPWQHHENSMLRPGIGRSGCITSTWRMRSAPRSPLAPTSGHCWE